jgi:hypothetical protein
MPGSWPELGDAQQHHVVVAVDADVVHLLEWPDSSPLCHSAGATGSSRPPGRARRCGQGLAVHPGEHQHVAAAGLLRDHRHQAVAVPLHGVEPGRPSGQCSQPGVRLRVGPACPRSAANQASTGTCPAAPAPPCHRQVLPGHGLAFAHLEGALPLEDLAEVQAHPGMRVVDISWCLPGLAAPMVMPSSSCSSRRSACSTVSPARACRPGTPSSRRRPCPRARGQQEAALGRDQHAHRHVHRGALG